MEPPSKGHFGEMAFVPCREVGPISEVGLFCIVSGLDAFLLSYCLQYNLYILLTGLAVNMARYCTSVQKYFPEPKARENTAHECNVSPY